MAINCLVLNIKFIILATTMDVEALRLLHTQRDVLKRLPNPDDAHMPWIFVSFRIFFRTAKELEYNFFSRI